MSCRKILSLERRMGQERRAAENAKDNYKRELHVIRCMKLDRKYVKLTTHHYILKERARIFISSLILASSVYLSGCASFIREITREPTPEEEKFYQQFKNETEKRRWEWHQGLIK